MNGVTLQADHEGAPSFVVFSDDWGEHMSSSQHLFRRIASQHQVLWVNTIGMRVPTLSWSDARKAWRKVGKTWRNSRARAQDPAEGLRLRVTQPFMLPYSGIGAVRSFNRRSVIRGVCRGAGELGMRSPIVVATVPNACDYVSRLGAAKIVYYCVDDFAQWPGLEHGLVRSMERDLIARSDLLLASSQHLYQTLAASGKPVRLLTHGVDLALFAQVAPAEHECLARIPQPRAGYFGLIDERTDQELLVSVASAMPRFSFVLTGPVTADTARLRRLPNVHFTGAVEYSRLPALIRGLDVLFIPYGVNDFSASISPLKLKEYLATGKPVVSTPLPEVLLQQQYVTIAASVQAWQAALNDSLALDAAARRQLMAGVLAGESWERKAAMFLNICCGMQERAAAVPQEGPRAAGGQQSASACS